MSGAPASGSPASGAPGPGSSGSPASGSHKKMIACPRCKFPNVQGTMACLSCKTALPGGIPGATPPAARGTTTRRLTREELGVIPPAAPPRNPAAPAPAPAWFDANAVVAWLTCDPLPPVPLGGDVVTIGRSDDCNLVLRHSSVSRVHAVVRVANGTLLFEDRSTFGSYVNGERQVSVNIKSGDVLTIGPFEVRVVSKQSMESAGRARDPMGETRPLGTSLRDLPSADAMTGRLEKQPLAEVLQAIEFNRKTGTLDLVCGETSGILVVYEGMPIHASFGGVDGDEAVYAMVCRTEGYYAFRTKVEPGEQTIKKPMTSLLLEASRRMDEQPAPPATNPAAQATKFPGSSKF